MGYGFFRTVALVAFCAVFGALGIPSVASAQYVTRDVPNWVIPPLIQGPQSGGVPTIGTIPPIRLQSVGLPLPPIGLAPPPAFDVPHPPYGTPGTRPGHHQRTYRGSTYPTYPTHLGWPTMVVVMPDMFAFGSALPGPARAEEVAPAAESTVAPRTTKGSLFLQVQPARVQVFVDGYYAGTVDDLDGTPGALMLDAGAHVVELDDPAYEHVRFDVRIDSNQPIIYRREMSPANAQPAAPLSSTSSPMYSIPGCYLGNVPPKDAGLPATCDPARAIRLR